MSRIYIGLLKCLAVCVFLLSFPVMAQPYATLATGTNIRGELQVLGVGAADGFAYLAKWQDTGGGWHPGGILPGQGVRFSTLAVGVASGGRNADLQVVGLGAGDGFAYLAGWQDTGGVWQPGGPLPGQGVRYSALVAGNGATTNSLQIIGLGASDGFAYLAAWQDTGGSWHPGGILPGQSTRLSSVYVRAGNNGRLQVVGIAAGTGQAFLAGWQDNGGTWQAGGPLPFQSPGFTTLALGNGDRGNLQAIGTGLDGLLYLAAWQDQGGTWHAGGILPGQGRAFSSVAVGRGNQSQLQVIGLGSDHVATPMNWQNTGGVWNVISGAPALSVPVSQIVTGSGLAGLQVLGVGQADGHVELITWQGSDGVWHAGGDLTP